MAIIGSQDIGDGLEAVSVDADPTTTSHDLLAGSFMIFGSLVYRKLIDGNNTSVERFGDFLSDGTVAMTGALDLGTNKITNLAAPTLSSDAARKQDVDSAVTGIKWKDPICTLGLVGNATVAIVNGLTPTAGDSYVMTDAGTLTAGSLAVAIGDLVEFDGTNWVKLVANSGGFVPSGTRAVVSTSVVLITPYIDGTDDGKIVAFSGASNTGTGTGDAVDGNAVLINCTGALNDNNAFVYDGTVATGTWVQFSGAGQINAGTGLTKTGNTLDVGDVNKGVQANADSVQVDASEIAGDGLKQTTGGGNEHILAVKPDVTTGGDTAAVAVGVNGVGLDVNSLDGDHLTVDFNPTNYTPDASIAEAANIDDLAAHLKGIDTEFLTAGFTKATVTTTDATLTTIATLAITDNTSVFVDARVVARRTDAAGRAGYVRKALVYREAAGAATRQGGTQSDFTRESVSGWNVQINVSGNNALIQVKGKTANTVNWKVSYQTFDVS